MAVNLSPVGGVAAQFFTNSGAPLTGGKIFTYAAGTTTPQASYTTSQGNVAWTNPIVLDAAGRVPSGGEIWLTDGLIYKFILKDANDVLIATYDNITGINSNSVAFVNQQEIVTATAGQTVFNLGISYQPATNSLSVFVDGVNQYGPGAQYSYVETDSNTVTFNVGLHVGAEVKFTTTQQQGAGAVDASQVSYDPPFTGSVATNVEAKLAQYVSVKDFGAVGNGSTDDTAAIQAALTASKYVTFGDASDVYKVTATLNLQDGQVLEFNRATVRMYTAQTRMFNAVGCENVIIRNGKLVGYKTDFVNSPSSLAVCVSVGTDSVNVLIENNWFLDFAYSPVSTVNYGQVSTFRFLNNTVSGPGATVLNDPNFRNCTGITIDGSDIVIKGNTIGDTAQGLIVAANSLDVVIEGNIVNTTITEHGMYIDAGVRNISVVGNVLKDIELTGIKFQNNDTYSNQEPQNIVCSNNTLLNIGQDGILVNNTSVTPTEYSNAVSITGNTIRAVGQDAINVRYVRNSAITGNVIFTAARYGIACTDTPGCVVDGNTISSTQYNGIFHDNSGNFVSVTNNVLVAPGLSGDNTNGNSSGILFGGGTGVGRNIAGNYVYGDEVKTQYALYYTGGDQTRTRISGNSFLNTNDYPVRLKSPTEALAYWGENRLLSFAGSREVSGLSTDLTQGSLPTFFATAAPTTGYWPLGYVVFNATPSAGGTVGWVCTAAGTPGTWKTFGAIAA